MHSIRLHEDIYSWFQHPSCPLKVTTSEDIEKAILCQWVGYGLCGRVISLLKSPMPGVYYRIDGGKIKPININPLISEQNKEDRERIYEDYPNIILPELKVEK